MTREPEELSPHQRAAVEAMRSGSCVRLPNGKRRLEGAAAYKKGWEIRFYSDSQNEANRLCRILGKAGLHAGRPYQKHKSRWIVPLYGREAVTEVLYWNELLSVVRQQEPEG